jgi:hypothetical protein
MVFRLRSAFPLIWQAILHKGYVQIGIEERMIVGEHCPKYA